MAEWIKTSTIEVSLFDCTGFDFRHSIENDLSLQGASLRAGYKRSTATHETLTTVFLVCEYALMFGFRLTVPFRAQLPFIRLLKNPCTDVFTANSIVSCLDCVTDSYVTALTMVCRSLCILWISVEILPNEFFCRSAFNVNCTSDFRGCHWSWIWKSSLGRNQEENYKRYE